MAKKIKNYKDMSREELIRYLETVESGVADARELVNGYGEKAQEALEAGNIEAANRWQLIWQTGDALLKTANLWAF